jgi:glycosyltransferase involved in cell wall biosynthesis
MIQAKRVLYVQYTDPAFYPPLLHSARILADQDWKVHFLGTGAYGAADLQVPPHKNIAVSRIKFMPAGLRQKLHFGLFHLWVILVALFWRPNWIYASDLLSCPSALLLNLIGFHVVYHEHDCPSFSPSSGVSRVLRAARRRLTQIVNFCVVPNRERAGLLKEDTATSRPIFAVWNCPMRDEIQEPEQRAMEDQKLILFYHGSIVPSRLPLAIIRAVGELRENIVLRIAGYETVDHRGYLGTLRRTATKHGLEDRLEFLGAIPHRTELLGRCREANVGLAFMPLQSEDSNEKTMLGASNKPFDYMACGLALLVSDLPDWEEIFVRRQYGLACDPLDPTSIAKALRWFLDHPEQRQRMGAEGRKRILADWNYETQFASVVDKLHASAANARQLCRSK